MISHSGELDLPVAFEIRCSARGERCLRVRAHVLALPTGAQDALLVVPVLTQCPKALVPHSFDGGAFSAPLCPKPGHDEFYDRDIAHLSPYSDQNVAGAARRFAGGAIKGVHLCIDYKELRARFEEYRAKGKADPLLWHGGKKIDRKDLHRRLKPEWQRLSHRNLHTDASNS